MFVSYGTVNSSIDIHFSHGSRTTRSGLSLVAKMSGGMVHGLSPRSE